jgi:hypothetical protein
MKKGKTANRGRMKENNVRKKCRNTKKEINCGKRRRRNKLPLSSRLTSKPSKQRSPHFYHTICCMSQKEVGPALHSKRCDSLYNVMFVIVVTNAVELQTC